MIPNESRTQDEFYKQFGMNGNIQPTFGDDEEGLRKKSRLHRKESSSDEDELSNAEEFDKVSDFEVEGEQHL